MSTLNGPSRGGDIGGGCHSEPPSTAQATIVGSAGLAGTPRLDFEAWTAFLRTSCGNQPDVIDPRAFTGWVRPMTVCGLIAVAMLTGPRGRSGIFVSSAPTTTMRYFRSPAGR